MKRSHRIGAAAIAAAAAVTFAVPIAAPASAALPQHVTCAKLTSAGSTSPQSKGSITNCTPTALKAGATSAFTKPPAGSQSGSLKGTYTWKNGKGKTIVLIVFKLQATPRKCPLGTTRVAVSGKVTGGSGAAAKIIKKNEPVAASICAVTAGPKAGQTTLEPGTKFKM